jgi:phosphonoacetaldehyde hydrolase
MANSNHGRPYRGSLRAVILDWSGTTVDYGSCGPAAGFIELFGRHGIRITTEQAREPMGSHKRDHIAALLRMPKVADQWQTVHGRAPTEDDVESLYQELIPLQLRCVAAYADLIPGTLEAVSEFHRRGLKIGSTTGFNRPMMDALLKEVAARGFEPDCAISVDDAPAGRPKPWMCYLNTVQLRVFPLEACVKVGDTPLDIEEGLNAGMWTVAVAKTGNELGLTEAELAALPAAALQAKLEAAKARLHAAGAHYVVDGIGDVPALLGEIEARLAAGERP